MKIFNILICVIVCLSLYETNAMTPKVSADIDNDNVKNMKEEVVQKEMKNFFKNSKEDGLQENGWYRETLGNRVYDYSPSNMFMLVENDYNEKGVLKMVREEVWPFFIQSQKIYDENGYLVKSYDATKNGYFEPISSFKIKPVDLVTFLEKEGWFNRKTGESFALTNPDTTGLFTYMINQYTSVELTSSKSDSSYFWTIEITLDKEMLPEAIIDKYCKKRDDGEIYFKDFQTGEFKKIFDTIWVTYVVDPMTGSFEIEWNCVQFIL